MMIVCLFCIWDNIVLRFWELVFVFNIKGDVKLVYFNNGVDDNKDFSFWNEFWYFDVYLLLKVVFGCLVFFLVIFSRGFVICEKCLINWW